MTLKGNGEALKGDKYVLKGNKDRAYIKGQRKGLQLQQKILKGYKDARCWLIFISDQYYNIEFALYSSRS